MKRVEVRTISYFSDPSSKKANKVITHLSDYHDDSTEIYY